MAFPPASFSQSSLSELSGYTLTEQLYQGSRTVVYRGVKTVGQRPVIIKVLQREYPSFGELVQFRNQYAIAQALTGQCRNNLSIPGIVQPLSLESVGNSYALVMEDWGGISLTEYCQQHPLDLIEGLGIALQLAEILQELHQHRVIHKDIKPANILIHPESKQIKLIDFSIASLLPKETQEIQNPNALEGTLAYMAPEQTGRMNRGVDYRVDYYALGVTLYELLTGHLPFVADDPLEMVHSHIAKVAPPVHQENPAIPVMVGIIVAKLMAKNAEDRYQSALGLKHDLEQCLTQWKETGTIAEFNLGQRDLCDRFLIPEKLYGRETAVQTLLDAFERVATGTSEMMLVAGFSGIGKTAVVNEVHKPIVKRRGYFIKGKFDQFSRNIPLSAFVQALRDLVGQLLGESDAQLKTWKIRILDSLGDNAQVIIDLIPELERIIGPQPPASELSGAAAQNRFNLLFQRFIHIFTTPEHPLVIFVDDLQWADAASLNLIQRLMADAKTGHLLLLGAYRDNEVFAAHPLMLTLDGIGKTGATIHTLTLQSLDVKSVNHLIADTFHAPEKVVQPLTDLVIQKTQGNPFFVTQFLKALYQDEWISFDRRAGHWQCDIVQVRNEALSDDVVTFMALQLQKLPEATQHILRLAACIGAQFDLETLAIVSEQSPTEVAAALWQALQEGLILPQSDIYKFYIGEAETRQNQPNEALSYKFLHDRVQQAAYSLIPDDQKQTTHFQIGQLLLADTCLEEHQGKLFEIVSQLNIGKALIVEPAQQEVLAQLNLEAGKKAKTATAYPAAIDFFAVGIELLGDNGWQRNYDLSLALCSAIAEVTCLSGEFDLMAHWIKTVQQQAKTLLDQIQAYQTQIQAYQAQNQLPQAVDTAIAVLKLLDIHFPEQPGFPDIQAALNETADQLSETAIEDLIDLPGMSDPYKLAAMSVLASVVPAVNQSAPTLLPLVVQKMLSLSLQYGNAPESSFAYALYGAVLCCVAGSIDIGYRFAQLGLNLLQRFTTKEFQSRTYFVANFLVVHWKDHLSNTLHPLLKAYQIGLETGDLEHASWSATYYCVHAYFVGNLLPELEHEMAVYSEVMRQSKQETCLHSLAVFHQVVLTWLGQRQVYQTLNDESDDLAALLQLFLKTRNHFAIATVHISQMVLLYGFGDYDRALIHAKSAEEYLIATAGSVIFKTFHVYQALAELAVYSAADLERQSHILRNVEATQAKLKHWASSAPDNTLHQFDLVDAELHRVLGLRFEALQGYDRAIAGAKANGYISDEALANELAAKFYLDWGKEKVAAGYMQEAYYCYSRWGAKAKTDDLEKRYPNLLRPILQQVASTFNPLETFSAIATPHLSIHASAELDHPSHTEINTALDFSTILQVAQSLSRTIRLDELFQQLSRIILQNSGGDRCALIFPNQDGDWYVEAVATPEIFDLCSEPLEAYSDLPIKLIQYVKNNQVAIVIDDLNTDLPVMDEYLMERQPKSILCLPILNQGKLLGILYLSNQSVRGSFTRQHIHILDFLCAQAGISLENARLYHASQAYAQQLEQSLEKLQESETRFHKLANNVPGLIYQIQIEADGTASMPYVSLGCQALYEVSADDLMSGKYSLRDFEHPDDKAALFQAVVESAQQLAPFQQEWRIIPPSGKMKWVKAASQPERRADGCLVWDGMLIDITDRKQVEAELQQKTKELEQTLQELNQTQFQIIQSEKMSSLGQMVAGVAHEINNPVNFIHGNLTYIDEYTQNLLDLVKLYQQHYPLPPQAIQEEIVAVDLPFLTTDLVKIIQSMRVGTKRIREIVLSLRNFSRLDESEIKNVDLHEGIDNTITILDHRLKAKPERPEIQIIRDYGDLPLVECYAGQLNQVFMNIISNAIDAIEEQNHTRTFENINENPNTISIQTKQISENWIRICIMDNGSGINESVRKRLFDPFFTTKPVGKGTGLGLSISYQIVTETHNGKLWCESTVGQGTQFIIEIPSQQTSVLRQR